MKKIIAITITIAGVLLVASCANNTDIAYDYSSENDAMAYVATEQETSLTEDVINNDADTVPLDLTIVRLDDEGGTEQLSDIVGMVDLGDGMYETGFGDTLMIRTNAPLREFAVIGIEITSGDDMDYFAVVGIIGAVVETFLPTEEFVILNYINRGTFPTRAITFIDENGKRYHFAIMQNQGYPDTGDRYILIPLVSSYPYKILTYYWSVG